MRQVIVSSHPRENFTTKETTCLPGVRRGLATNYIPKMKKFAQGPEKCATMAQFTFVTAMSVQACLHAGYRNEPNKIEKGQLCQKLTYSQQPTGGARS